MVVLGDHDGFGSIDDAQVDRYNNLQVRIAKDSVYYRPSAHLDALIPRWRD